MMSFRMTAVRATLGFLRQGRMSSPLETTGAEGSLQAKRIVSRSARPRAGGTLGRAPAHPRQLERNTRIAIVGELAAE